MHFGPEDDAGVSSPKTTPSHSQSVEAAELIADLHHRAEWLRQPAIGELKLGAVLEDIAADFDRAVAALTSQQEVAAPVGPLRKLQRAIECLEILNQRPRPMCRDCADSKFEGICDNGGLDCDMGALIVDSKASLKVLAASPAGEGEVKS